MTKRLRQMFDYQRFENNLHLKEMLDRALARYGFREEGELSDDEAGMLNAAGSMVVDPRNRWEDDI